MTNRDVSMGYGQVLSILVLGQKEQVFSETVA